MQSGVEISDKVMEEKDAKYWKRDEGGFSKHSMVEPSLDVRNVCARAVRETQ